MPTTFTSNVFSSTYKDDFKDSDNYHRILFNSGRALQARELTQMQTIIQEEIARFGRNIFKDGAAVNPGGPSINNDYRFVKLSGGSVLPTDPTTLVGTEFTGATSTVKARVLEVVVATDTDPATLYVQYTNTSGGSVGTTAVRFNTGETISNGSTSLQVQTKNEATNPSTGVGSKIHNDGGDFFVRGHFVFVNPQGLILSKYTNNATKIVGFKITEDIVTTADDTALFDNQGVTPNVTSPGADRYRIKLTLTTQDQIAADENFVFYCHVVNGEIVDQASGTDDYNKITDLLAERTKEESGNYIAKKFNASLSDSGENILVNISSGIAYVNGYRATNDRPISLVVPKPQTTLTLQNNTVGLTYGSYFICSSFTGKLNISTFETVNLSTSTSDPSGSVIGTAKVRYVEKDGSNFKVYLFDIKMNSGKSLRNVKTIGLDASNFALILQEGSPAKSILKETNKVNLVYPTNNPRPRILTDASFEVQRIITGTPSGGALTIGLTTGGETFVNTGQILITRNNGAVATPSSITGTGTANLTFAGLPNELLTLYVKVNKGTPQPRQKSLSSVITKTASITTDGDASFIDLHATDLHDVSAIKQTDSDGIDLSSRFTIDNGQRASHYANARLIVNDGTTAPSGDVFVKFRHFTHGSGDFFSVNSYGTASTVAYENIPDFKPNNRTSINLRDVIDFRSSVDSDGLFVGSGVAINELPTNGDAFQADIEYYLPRADKVFITTQGEVKLVQGEPGFNTQIPSAPENSLELFNLNHNGYGLNSKDTSVTPIESKRFTMRDISNLEKRIDKLEEVTSLSLLEVDTSSILVLDSAGNPRSKSGFFVDNFKNRAFIDGQNPNNRSAIDPSLGVLLPQQYDNNISLVYDSDKSTNTILKGDTVYIKYSEDSAISQKRVSGSENVNPFAVLTGIGNITMSPASDEWQDTVFLPENVIEETAIDDLGDPNDGGRVYPMRSSTQNFLPIIGYGPYVQNLFNGFNGTRTWNWNGSPITPPPTIRNGGGFLGSIGNVAMQTSRRAQDFSLPFSPRIVISTQTIREVTGDRQVSLTFLPFIRSRKVFFKAEGLRPNTRYFPFFDNTQVNLFVKQHSQTNPEPFVRMSALTAEARKLIDGVDHKLNRDKTSHPGGSTNLVSDADGKIEGSFFIPCNPVPRDENGDPLPVDTNKDVGVRFRAGTREFKLLDISQNDDSLATSSARFNYIAQGTLETRQQTITSTRTTIIRPMIRTRTQPATHRDPLAQSFRVPTGSGMYVTKIDCFFKTKDDSIAVALEIRPMINGHPSSTDIISNAVKFVSASAVALPAGQTSTEVLAAPTTFEFDEPIFLNPDTEYAMVLLAESTNYEAYVAETYEFELGSTEKRINRQPAMGSLFKSQNGSTWEPDQTKDLMFVIHQAIFDTAGGNAVFENGDAPKELLIPNALYSNSGSNTITMYNPNHGYIKGDTPANIAESIDIVGLDSDTVYNGILGSSIMGSKVITVSDGFGIQFNADSAATSSGRFGGSTMVTDRQIPFDGCVPNFTTILPDDTNIVCSVKFMSGVSFAGSEAPYTKSSSFSSDIVIGEENYFDSPKLIANSSKETSELGAGERSTTFNIRLSTSNSNVSPIIDGQRSSLTTISNLIDRQISGSPASHSGFNVPLNYVPETKSSGGSSLAKHISSVQVLEDTSVGLKVILSALRPTGADFELYWRTAQDGENILDIDWTLEPREQVIPTDDKNFREYRYLIGGQGGDVEEFTQYQYKIVMTSTNSCAPPVFKDFRSIAMAV